MAKATASADPTQESFEFVLRWEQELAEKDPGYVPTRFYSRDATEDEITEYMDLLPHRPAQASLHLLRKCLTGWADLRSHDGVGMVPFRKGSTEGMHQEWRYEAAAKIADRADPRAADLRQSASLSSWG